MSSRSSLNHIYRTVWNEALGAVVAVAETAACNRGGASCTVAGSAVAGGIPAFAPSTLLLALALAWGITPQAHANPTGGVAIQGQATMATKGNVLTVTTQNGAGTNHSAINWQSFSIPAGNVTRFDQPNAASTSINRVVTNTPSVLFGTLSSNGKVVLVNQSGIAVGAGAVVDTAGFTAAAMKMSEADAISGRLRFDGVGGLLGVQGNIISRGGDVVLIAPSVEVARDAVVESQGGSVVLAAGQKVEVTGRGLEGISLQVQAPTDQALNLGTLKGDAVGIFAGTLKHSGAIQATQASMEGGKVVLKAAGDTYVEGNATINAGNAKGGTVAVLGQRVAVTDKARIDASGTNGGGTVLVGGDYQGKNPAVQNASVTYVGPDTQLKADASDKGDGGKVIVWSDDTTRAFGNISARGGANGGDGGFIETSGHRYLDYRGRADTLAPYGKAGTLLLDPADLTIDASTNPATNGGSFDAFSVFSTTLGSSTLGWNLINTQTGNVKISTSSSAPSPPGNITVTSGGTLSTSITSLDLLAYGDITFNSGAMLNCSPNCDLNLVAGWNGTGLAVSNGTGNVSLSPGSGLSAGTGSVFINAGNSIAGTGTIAAGTLTLGNSNAGGLPGGVNLTGANMVNTLAIQSDGASGSLTFSNAQNLTIGSGGFGINGIHASNKTAAIDITTTNGNLTVSQDIRADQTGGNANIKLQSANALNLNASVVTATGSPSTAGIKLIAGSGGISGSSGSVSAKTLEISSAGNVRLDGTNTIKGTLAGSVTGSGFDFNNSDALEVGLVGSTNGLSVSNGDIQLQIAAQDKLLKITQPVMAPAGNVTYIADNIDHGSATTTSTASDKFVNVRPHTAATNVDLGLSSDIPGTMRMSNAELDNFKTPLLKIGNSSTAGSISVVAPIAPSTGSFTAMSLITGGAISQTSGSTITIANLNADGGAGVTLTESNAVTNLAGHTQSGSFAFTNNGNLNISKVDVINGIDNAVSGNTTLTSSTGNITQSSTGPLKSPGTLTVSAQSGISLSTASNAVETGLVFVNAGSGALGYKGSMTNVLDVNATNTSGNITIDATGPYLKASNVSTSGSGNITFKGSNDVKLAGNLTSVSGSVSVTATSGQIINYATHDVRGAQVSLTGGTGVGGSGAAIKVTATGAVNALATTGDVYVTSTGNLPLGSVIATGTANLVSTSGAITDANSTANNITAPGLQLSAFGGIGVSDPIETQVSTLSANTTSFGNIAIANSGTTVTLGTLSSADGRWLVYADNPARVVKGSNTTSFRMYNNATPPSTGNGLVYASAPGTVTVDTLLASGSPNHIFGSTPTAVFNKSLVNTSSFDNEDFALISGTATFSPAISSATNAGTYSVLYASGLTSTAGYTFSPGIAVSYTVDPAVVTAVTAALTGSTTKTYDGTTAATLAPANFQLTGFVNGDSATVTKTSGTYASKNVGSSIPVSTSLTNSDFTPVGSTLLSNYSLPTSASGDIGSITPAALTIAAAADTKTYDGSTSSSAVPTPRGLVSSDTITGLSQTYDNRNAGTSKTLRVATGYTINDGNSGKNYTVTTTNSSTGVITPAPLTIAPTANTKTYDGTISSSAVPTPSGLVSGDTVTGLSQTYDNRNAGTSKTLRVSSGYTINDGNSGNNYTVTTISSSSGSITPAPLAITPTADTKTYDGTVNSSALPTSSGLISGDTITGLGQSYDSPNAGTGKTLRVAAGYTVNDGNSGNNYTVAIANSSTGTITPAPLTISAAANTKTYDGTTSASALPTSKGLVASDTITGLAQTYDDRNAGTGKTLRVSSGYTINDGNSGKNYTVATVDSNAGTITPAPLTITATANSKTYDGTASASALPTSKGLVAGDTITGLAQIYDNRNVGTGKTLSVSSGYTISDGNSGNNYTVATVNSNAGTITPALLTITPTADTKTYDGTTKSSVLPTPKGLVAGDTIAGLSQAYDDHNAGTGKTLRVAAGYTINDSNFGNNYTVTTANSSSGVITRAPLTVTAKDASKTFGQTLNLTGSEFSATGLQNGEAIGSVVLFSSGFAASASVAGGPYPIIPSNANGGTFSPSNYNVTYVNGALTVTPAPLTVVTAALTGATTKTYDGTTSATLTPANFLLGGFVNGDAASVTKTTGDYENKNVGSRLVVSTTLASTDFAPAGSTQLSNYSLPTSASGPIGSITPAPLTVTAKDASKTFGKTVSFAGSEFSASGLRNGETIGSVALSSAGAAASASVAGGPYPIIPSNASGGTFSSSNYNVTYVNGVLTVTPAPLVAVTAALTGTTTKTYDGTTVATLTPANFLLDGFVNGDSASVTKTTGDYASKDVGSRLMVSTTLASSDFAPAGSTQLSNYSLPTSASGAIGSITPAPLTVTAKDTSKTFGKTVNFTGSEFSASGLRNGETIGSVALSSAGAAASASVAGGPYPIISSNASGGTFSPSNYNVTYVNGVLTVTPAPLTAVTAALTGTTTKTYDGTTTATLTPANFLLDGFVNGDSASVTKTTGDYASKNVGAKLMVSTTLASSDFAPAGSTQLSNYSLPTSASGAIGSITPASLTVTAKDASKTFGSTVSFTGSEFSASGLRNGETIGNVALGSTGAAAGASVAGGPYPIIPSNASGGTFSPGNYTVTYVNGVLTVTPATLTAVAAALTGSTTKTYDGTTIATLTPANFLLSGFVNGDSASVTKTTGNYANQNVGTNLMVSTTLASSDFAPTGSTQLSNYSLPTSASGAIGSITPAPLTVTAKDASKTFGKTLSFTGGEFSASGLQNGETIGSVALSSTGAVANASVAGGPYPIIPGNANGGTFSPGNYNVTYLNGVLTVTPAPLTAVAAALTGTTTKTYDGTPTATLTPANFLLSGFASGDSASVTKTTGNYESKNVGSNLMVSTTLASSDFAPAGSTQLSNYRLPTSASGPIGSITPAPLTVTAKDASKTFGTTLSFTGNEFSSSGLRNGETIGNVALSSTGAAASAGVAGSPYPIIPSNANGGTFSLGNYNVTYFNGALTVNSAQTGTPIEPSVPPLVNEPGAPEAGMARAPSNLVVAFVEKMKAAAIETAAKTEDKKKPRTDIVLEGEICRP